MLSDGYSTAFKAVQDMKPYVDTELTKLECINHAHKRMGTALRKLAKTEKLGGRRAGRLTMDKCNILQSYHRNAIQENLGNVDEMKNAVLATLRHSMSTDTLPSHECCPKGSDSWCFYRHWLQTLRILLSMTTTHATHTSAQMSRRKFTSG